MNNLLHLEPCKVMLIVTSDIMAHWNVMLYTMIFHFNFWNGKKMNCLLIQSLWIKMQWKEIELFIDVNHKKS